MEVNPVDGGLASPSSPSVGEARGEAAQARALVVARGAEATVETASFLEEAVLAKRRTPKSYRHPAIDARLRAERTRDEAAILAAARRCGVRVPVVVDADRQASTILMEHVAAPSLRDVLEHADTGTAAALLGQLGRQTARLHAAGLTHGDLTTSNVLVAGWPGPAGGLSLVLIDFGLGAFSQEEEPRGVDLHLVEEALEATHEQAALLFEAFLVAYQLEWPAGTPRVLERLEDIRGRGRYR